MPELAVEEVPTPGGLGGLRDEWLDLWERAPAATPFQSPAWLVPWWDRFGQGDPLTLAVRRDGRLVGLAPLYVLHEPGGRKLLPQGVGVSDYLDPLLDPAHEREAAAAVVGHLAGQARRFDRCDLGELRPGSPLLEARLPPGWAGTVVEGEPCPVLALDDLPGAARSRLGRLPYYLRRAERLGPARLGTASDPGEAAEFLEALFALHGARWAARGEPGGVLADPAVRAFHREAARNLLALGLLRLHGLRVGGRLVAVFHGFADRLRAHAYIGGFDPAVPHPGLGAAMLGHAVQGAMGEGLREFHFLRGREPYKYAWGAVDRPGYARRLTPPRPPGAT